MPAHKSGRVTRARRLAIVIATTIAGVGAAVLVSVAVARTFTLQIAKNAKVTSTLTGPTKTENIVVNSKGKAVYTLSGDSKSHPECVMNKPCLTVWPPVTVASARKLSRASGIHGKLGTWRHNGFTQVTLNGHPLYTFSADTQRHHAMGEGIVHFGGTWHVIKTSSSSSSTTSTPTTTTSTTTTSPYPPGY